MNNIITSEEEKAEIYHACSTLMGENGDIFAEEIINTGMLTPRSYESIEADIYYNGRNSVTKYFGLIHYYLIQWRKNVTTA